MPARADVDKTGVGVDRDVLHQSSWRPLVRLAYLLVDDVALAEDVVQGALLGLCTGRASRTARREATSSRCRVSS